MPQKQTGELVHLQASPRTGVVMRGACCVCVTQRQPSVLGLVAVEAQNMPQTCASQAPEEFIIHRLVCCHYTQLCALSGDVRCAIETETVQACHHLQTRSQGEIHGPCSWLGVALNLCSNNNAIARRLCVSQALSRPAMLMTATSIHDYNCFGSVRLCDVIATTHCLAQLESCVHCDMPILCHAPHQVSAGLDLETVPLTVGSTAAAAGPHSSWAQVRTDSCILQHVWQLVLSTVVTQWPCSSESNSLTNMFYLATQLMPLLSSTNWFPCAC